ncbi:hypothetical protein OROMI_006583 [Orobanche minor]
MDPAEVPNLPVSEEEKNPTRGTRTRGTRTQMTPTRTTRTCGTPTRTTPTRTIPTRTTPTRTIPTRTTPTRGQKQKQPNKRIYTTRNEVIKQSQSKKKKVK